MQYSKDYKVKSKDGKVIVHVKTVGEPNMELLAKKLIELTYKKKEQVNA